MTVTMTDRNVEPTVPATLTEYVPGGVLIAEIVMDETPNPPGDSVMVVGLKEIEGPLVTTGETVALRPMVPAKPLLLVSVTPRLAELPVAIVTVALAKVNSKSVT
jgi:hypothetical protein